MTKPTQKQLELTAGKSREELIQATAPHIDFESPAFKESLKKVEKIEMAEAARAVLGPDAPDQEREVEMKTVASRANQILISAGLPPKPEYETEEFDWDTDDSVILREQRATAAYRNRHGELIIRQRASWCDDGDTFVYISPENEVTFMEGLAKRARE